MRRTETDWEDCQPQTKQNFHLSSLQSLSLTLRCLSIGQHQEGIYQDSERKISILTKMIEDQSASKEDRHEFNISGGAYENQHLNISPTIMVLQQKWPRLLTCKWVVWILNQNRTWSSRLVKSDLNRDDDSVAVTIKQVVETEAVEETSFKRLESQVLRRMKKTPVQRMYQFWAVIISN